MEEQLTVNGATRAEFAAQSSIQVETRHQGKATTRLASTSIAFCLSLIATLPGK
jgi:hypothetical protein